MPTRLFPALNEMLPSTEGRLSQRHADAGQVKRPRRAALCCLPTGTAITRCSDANFTVVLYCWGSGLPWRGRTGRLQYHPHCPLTQCASLRGRVHLCPQRSPSRSVARTSAASSTAPACGGMAPPAAPSALAHVPFPFLSFPYAPPPLPLPSRKHFSSRHIFLPGGPHAMKGVTRHGGGGAETVRMYGSIPSTTPL